MPFDRYDPYYRYYMEREAYYARMGGPMGRDRMDGPPPPATASLPATGWGQTDSQTPETDSPLPDPSWMTELDLVLTPTSETEILLVPDLLLSTMSGEFLSYSHQVT